jgi:hypothetical protein
VNARGRFEHEPAEVQQHEQLDPEFMTTRPGRRSIRSVTAAHAAAASRRPSPASPPSREHRIVAVPLDEVGAAHEGAVLRRPAVVMPQIEVDEVDRLRERRRRQHAVLSQRGHQVGGLLHFRVRRRHDLFGLGIDALDQRSRVALIAHGLHRLLRVCLVRPGLVIGSAR